MTIEALGALAASILSIIGLIMFFVKPVLTMSNKLNETIHELNLTMKLLSKDLEASKEDQLSIHAQLDQHDSRLDEHGLTLAEHGQQIKTLFAKEAK